MLDRTKQFAPFAALRDYSDYTEELYISREEGQVYTLNNRDSLKYSFAQLTPGLFVRICVVDADGFMEAEGYIDAIDEELCVLRIDGVNYFIDKLVELEIIPKSNSVLTY